MAAQKTGKKLADMGRKPHIDKFLKVSYLL
jgi:hypothetical protein